MAKTKDYNVKGSVKQLDKWIHNNPLEYQQLIDKVKGTGYSYCFHGLNSDGSPILTLESPFTINRNQKCYVSKD